MVAELQGLAQLGGALDQIPALARLALYLGGQVLLGLAQLLAQLTHQGAIGSGLSPTLARTASVQSAMESLGGEPLMSL